MKLLAQLGTIDPPEGAVTVTGDPTSTIAGLIRNGISLLLIASFVIALIWTIIAGLRFVFSGGDEKAIGQSWSSIYWGLIGMVVVMGSFAIIKLVETFFAVEILTGGLKLTQ
ncbi:hypothetical protein A3F45_03465 [Candidatus Curtissbacteria bacterium RIFCSPHIGHO2_12_FULL_41_17]|uniref:Uncharacterized protein n=1 Tax=Candidatus Curtissbacteria bacterium RIFCSPHIGHO2_12_FULL_41_17 TaxID=1797722 RepID=A0A1F5HMH8_9BACT|nr:MAG: hypothetical protein A3F45_03465 [Candidatus Curtissbacteria bacterium RIFCSPHIGHO2_12_FULL_41_17]